MAWPLRVDETITYGYALLSLVKVFERTDDVGRGSAVCVVLVASAAAMATALARHGRRHEQAGAAADDDDDG